MLQITQEWRKKRASPDHDKLLPKVNCNPLRSLMLYNKGYSIWPSQKHESYNIFWIDCNYEILFLGLQSFQLCVSGLKISAREKSIQEVVGDEPLGQSIHPSLCQFRQCSTSSFCSQRSQKHNKDWQLDCLFVLSGSACLKAVHRMLMKLTPCLQQQKKLASGRCWSFLNAHKCEKI
jgi:hypothetical protein